MINCVKALENLMQGGETTAYNLGNGQGFSVKEVIEAAKKVTGKNFTTIIGEQRTGDPPKLIGDANRIKNELNWSPQYTDLETIISTAWNWHQRS